MLFRGHTILNVSGFEALDLNQCRFADRVDAFSSGLKA